MQKTRVLLFVHYFSCFKFSQLTHRSGGYRHGRTEPLAPSTWLEGDPAWRDEQQFEQNNPKNITTTSGLEQFMYVWSHVGGLFIVVDVVDVTSQAEVGDLHYVVLCDQHVPGSQVSVDALQEKRWGGELRGSGHTLSHHQLGNSPFWRPGTPSPWPPDRQRTPAPWAPCWPGRRAESRSSTPSQRAGVHGGTPSGCPARRTPPPRTEGLRVWGRHRDTPGSLRWSWSPPD